MKHRGRPPVDDDEEGSAKVCVTLPAKQFDEYAKRALREDVSVAEIVRRELQAQRKGE